MTHRRFAPLVSLALVLMLPAAAQANHRAVSATGVKQVDGQTMYVDVLVALKHGQSAQQATDKALSEQGASRRKKPPGAGGPGGGGGGGEQYFYTGLVWSPPSVVQNYNAANEPLGAKSALTNTYSDWNGVANSLFSIGYGQDTNRCPSLVRECPGAQVKDPYNDVAWLPLSGSTLGVTWSTASSPEADMALSTRFAWKNTCGAGSGYDLETVLLHENGHVAGLDHPNRTDSVMYASYQSPRCELYDYDRRSLANLY